MGLEVFLKGWLSLCHIVSPFLSPYGLYNPGLYRVWEGIENSKHTSAADTAQDAEI